MLLGVHRLLHCARPHGALDLPRDDHAHAGRQLHQPRGRHRLQGRLLLLLPQRRPARRQRFHPLDRRRGVLLQPRRHLPDHRHDRRRGRADRRPRPLRPPRGRDDRLDERRRDRALQRRGHERRMDRERRLDQGRRSRLRRRSRLVRSASGVGGRRRRHRAQARRPRGDAGRHVRRSEHRRLADVDDRLLPRERRRGNARPASEVHRRERQSVQRGLVAVRPGRRRQRQRRIPVARRRPVLGRAGSVDRVRHADAGLGLLGRCEPVLDPHRRR